MGTWMKKGFEKYIEKSSTISTIRVLPHDDANKRAILTSTIRENDFYDFYDSPENGQIDLFQDWRLDEAHPPVNRPCTDCGLIKTSWWWQQGKGWLCAPCARPFGYVAWEGEI